MSSDYEIDAVAPEQTPSVPDPAATGAVDLPEEPLQAKTFTQAELDGIIEKRLAKEHRKLERLQRDSDIAAAVAQDRQARSQASTEPTEPALENFETYEKFIEAKANWVVEQKFAQHLGSMRQEAQRTVEQQSATAAWNTKVTAAQRTYADFAEVVHDPDLVITPVMGDAIRSSDVGTDVAYYLGKHPQEASRIAGLDAISQIRAIGRLEATLPKSKVVSSAAAPIQAVRGSASGSNDIYETGISFTEYKRRREAQMKAQ